MADLVWEDPPRASVTNERASGLGAALDALRQRPGEWARVLVYPVAKESAGRTQAGNIRRGMITSARPAGVFEAVSRKIPDGIAVYARYVGPTPKAVRSA